MEKLRIVEYFHLKDKKDWLLQIENSNWPAGQELANYIKNNELEKFRGKNPLLPLLIDNSKLVSYCLLCEIDNINNPNLKPWIGFVYTDEEYRGHHYIGKLIRWCENKAKKQGYSYIYISTRHIGLYEKHGYELYDIEKDINDIDCRVYFRKIK